MATPQVEEVLSAETIEKLNKLSNGQGTPDEVVNQLIEQFEKAQKVLQMISTAMTM